MSGFIRRFTSFPTLDVLSEIEGVSIVSLVPAGIFVGRTTGTVLLVGEWPKGPVNTPTAVDSAEVIQSTFGGFSLSMTDPLSFAVGPPAVFTNPYSNGCAFTWLKSKSYRRLVLVRADLSLAEGVKIQLTGTPTPTEVDITIPAGTRVRDASNPEREYALAADVVFAAGTDLAVAAFTNFADGTASYSTRTVAGIPVYSTKGQNEGAVGNVDTVDATDLFRAGIGAGTALASVVVAATTGALDTAPANSAELLALSSGTIDTRYEEAIDAALPGDRVVANVDMVASARQSTAIRTKLREHVIESSAQGPGRRACIRPPIGTMFASAIGAVAPGVGATRAERVIYCYPHFEQSISEIATLDPTAAISSQFILVGADSAMASILSVLPPENNPGQSTSEFFDGGLINGYIRKLEDGLTTAGLPTKFTMANYISFKSSGIAALRYADQIDEWVFQSGVTSVNSTQEPGRTAINRLHMADFLEDSMAGVALRYVKKPRTTDRVNALIGDLTGFLELMLSEADTAKQRIAGYSIDTRSGNTPTLQGSGIFVMIINVRTLDDFNQIVLQVTAGPNADIAVSTLS